jgi:hypothetical protein
MKHTYHELYRINGKGYYTEDYIKAHNISVCNAFGETGEAHRCRSIGVDKGTKKIHDIGGVRVVYTYGEKTWFDSEEERDAYRATMNEARAEQTKKNNLLKIIMAHYESMSIEQLNDVVTTL